MFSAFPAPWHAVAGRNSGRVVFHELYRFLSPTPLTLTTNPGPNAVVQLVCYCCRYIEKHDNHWTRRPVVILLIAGGVVHGGQKSPLLPIYTATTLSKNSSSTTRTTTATHPLTYPTPPHTTLPCLALPYPTWSLSRQERSAWCARGCIR